MQCNDPLEFVSFFQQCVYGIRAPLGTNHTTFTFLDEFDVEPHIMCNDDFIEFRDSKGQLSK